MKRREEKRREEKRRDRDEVFSPGEFTREKEARRGGHEAEAERNRKGEREKESQSLQQDEARPKQLYIEGIYIDNESTLSTGGSMTLVRLREDWQTN